MEFNDIEVENAIKHLLKRGLGVDINDPNFKETPERVARSFREMCRGLYDKEVHIESFKNAIFPSKNNEMIVMKNIDTYSLCPHHLLPVKINACVGYIPNGRVVGLSKLARLTEVVSCQPILQEDLTVEIVDFLMQMLEPEGAAAFIEGYHSCMGCRGVKKPNAVTVTSAVRGVFMDDPSCRHEFLELVRR